MANIQQQKNSIATRSSAMFFKCSSLSLDFYPSSQSAPTWSAPVLSVFLSKFTKNVRHNKSKDGHQILDTSTRLAHVYFVQYTSMEQKCVLSPQMIPSKDTPVFIRLRRNARFRHQRSFHMEDHRPCNPSPETRCRRARSKPLLPKRPQLCRYLLPPISRSLSSRTS